MADDNKLRDDGPKKGGGEFRVPPRTYILWIAILGAIPLLMVFKNRGPTQADLLNQIEFTKLVRSNLIVRGKIIYDPQSSYLHDVEGRYKKVLGEGRFEERDFRARVRLTEIFENQLLETNVYETKQPNTMVLGLFYSLGPILLIGLLIWFVFIRQIKMAGKGALSFGKSKARMLAKEKNKTTFKDVAGVEEAKDEVSELVEFLKDPKKFQKLGGRIPKGILMIGAPGTGKTLLAKAIAGEADAAFFSISGSDFVEMFVGVGASRVRDMFDQARKNTPCLVFIDEIDAVGRSRGHGLGGGNDEREQTLNALLVEMDGFDTTEGIIIIAATNRPDVLDPALLRPGRFDRQITVNLPDVRGREAILKVHAKNVKLDPAADLSVIARGTPGYSGAELANLLNEAALLAARTNKKAVGMAELEEARDKVRWGRERRSLAMTDEDKKCTAWHEAGHALVNVLLQHTHPLHKVTIIPRMVTQWGMSEKIGMVQYGDSNEFIFLGREMVRSKDYSEHMAQEIDTEVKRIIDENYERARELIFQNQDKLQMIADALLEYETLEGALVEEIVRTGRFTPPPPPPPSGPPTGAQAATPLPEVIKPSQPKIDPGLGSAAPAPA